jgi:hypothetical protein
MKTVVRYLAENSTNPFASCKIATISIFLVFFIFVHFAPSTLLNSSCGKQLT